MYTLIIEYAADCQAMDFESFGVALFQAQAIAECHPGVWSVWITDTEVCGDVLYEQVGSIPALSERLT